MESLVQRLRESESNNEKIRDFLSRKEASTVELKKRLLAEKAEAEKKSAVAEARA